jgi:hypothetical protein
MVVAVSIFLDFNLPNATTWFYFSFLLAVALFFKFSRLMSIRNWDVVTLFLLVPGFLMLQQGRTSACISAGVLVGIGGEQAFAGWGNIAAVSRLTHAADAALANSRWLWIGYLWLLCGSAYFLLRCLLDLTLVRRPALQPNLNFGGLAWLAGALLICLTAVAYRHPDRGVSSALAAAASTDSEPEKTAPVGRESAPLAFAQSRFNFWLARTFAMLCHLFVVVGLIVIGTRHFQDPAAGMAAATFYLILPYTGMYVGQAHHVWPMALVVWALAAYRLPMLAGFLLGLAASTAYFTAFLFPIWLSFYWRRGAGRFLVAFFVSAIICLGTIGSILWVQGELAEKIREALTLPDWQPWKVPTTEGFWTGVHWAYRIPVFIAFVAFVLTTACWPSPKNLAHVISLSAAVLVGLQFWYADQGGVYILWYLPLLLLLVFRPNLDERRPASIQTETDWLSRSFRLHRPADTTAVKATDHLNRSGQTTGPR